MSKFANFDIIFTLKNKEKTRAAPARVLSIVEVLTIFNRDIRDKGDYRHNDYGHLTSYNASKERSNHHKYLCLL